MINCTCHIICKYKREWFAALYLRIYFQSNILGRTTYRKIIDWKNPYYIYCDNYARCELCSDISFGVSLFYYVTPLKREKWHCPLLKWD